MLGNALDRVAVTVKQTAIFPGAFLGILIFSKLFARDLPMYAALRKTTILLLVTSLPWLIIAAIYLEIGHFRELLQAMTTSNLTKGHERGG